MAITQDSDTAYASYGNVASFSFSHTCSGSDRLLMLSINHNYTGLSPTISATYNGVAMTFIVHSVTGSAARATDIFGLLAPDTGTHTVAVTVGAQGSTEHYSGSTSFNGVLQTPPINNDSGAGNATAGTTVTTSGLITTVDNCWAYFGFGKNGTTANTNAIILSSSSGRGAGTSNGSIGTAGTYDITINKTSGANCGIIAVAFAPSVGSATTNPSFLLNFM